jgi:uncharacterized membrane protein YfcA
MTTPYATQFSLVKFGKIRENQGISVKLRMEVLTICLLFALIGGLYAAVGHGGASGYLAFMAIIGVSPALMKPTALLLNLGVAAISFLGFYHAKHFKWSLLHPFLWSMPAAWIGAGLPLTETWYKKILAVCLILAVWRLLGFGLNSQENQPVKPMPYFWAMCIGIGIGLISGMIGIGGGIILTPILLLKRWARVKEAAAVSAAFIFLNSLAGLSNTKEMDQIPLETWAWMAAAMLGGIIGSLLGSKTLSPLWLRGLLGTGLALAAIKLAFLS